MCQLIKAVKRFIWKLSADQLIVLLDPDQCSISYFLGSLEAHACRKTDNAHKYYWTSMFWSIDSYLNRVTADQYHLTLSWAQVLTHRGQVFFWSYQQTSYLFSNDHRLKFFFFKLIWNNYVVFMFHTIKILISNGHKNSASYYRQGRQLLLTLLTMVTSWSCSTSNFCALIGQNLTGEFMRKIYAASWNLFTLTAEADRVLCQLVMFLTVFLRWMYKMKFLCYQESSVIHSSFVYWVFGWEIRRLSKSEMRFRMALFSFFTLLDA